LPAFASNGIYAGATLYRIIADHVKCPAYI
jgi:hypothetical protein